MFANGEEIHELLRNDPGRRERLITADLGEELRRIAGDTAADIPELRGFLAVSCVGLARPETDSASDLQPVARQVHELPSAGAILRY